MSKPVLAIVPGLHAWDIADYFDYDQASTYGRLSRLRRQGLVWRSKVDRATLYGITSKGRSRLEYFEENLLTFEPE